MFFQFPHLKYYSSVRVSDTKCSWENRSSEFPFELGQLETVILLMQHGILNQSAFPSRKEDLNLSQSNDILFPVWYTFVFPVHCKLKGFWKDFVALRKNPHPTPPPPPPPTQSGHTSCSFKISQPQERQYFLTFKKIPSPCQQGFGINLIIQEREKAQCSVSLGDLNTRLNWLQKVIRDTEHELTQTKSEGQSIKQCTCIPERITHLSS